MDALTVILQTTPQQIVLHAAGEVMDQTMMRLEDVMQQALAQPDLPVVLDLRHVTHMDAKGLTSILTAGQQFVRSRRGLTVRVTAGSQPERVLELSQIDNLLLRLGGPDALYFFVIVVDDPST